MVYQVVFCQGYFSCVDFETESLEQAEEVKMERCAAMAEGGERDFCYVIKKKR